LAVLKSATDTLICLCLTVRDFQTRPQEIITTTNTITTTIIIIMLF
jgi:hypothetical protein